MVGGQRKIYGALSSIVLYRALQGTWKVTVLGSGGVWGAILTLNVQTWTAQPLCIVILVHLGLVTFSFHVPKFRTITILMLFGPSERDHDSPNQLRFLSGPPHYFT